jgi:hypothetical protein
MGVRGSPGYRTGLPLPGRINGGGTTLALATECLAIAAVGHKALSARRTVFFERQALVLECTQFGPYLRLGRKLASGSNKHDTTHKFRPINSKHAGDTVSVRPSCNDGRGGAGFLDCNSYVACIVVQREALDGPDALSETHPTSPRSSLPFLALRRSSNAAAFSNAPRAAGPTPRRRGQIRAQADPHPAPAEGGPRPHRGRGDAAQRRPQLQCQSGDDFPINGLRV